MFSIFNSEFSRYIEFYRLMLKEQGRKSEYDDENIIFLFLAGIIFGLMIAREDRVYSDCEYVQAPIETLIFSFIN